MTTEGEQKIIDTLHEFKLDVMQKFNDGEKRFDKQDIAISDIQDQIKGNTTKEITGLKPAIKEIKRVLFVPIIIYRLPRWAKWALAAVVTDAIVDINHIGVITLLQYLVHAIKP